MAFSLRRRNLACFYCGSRSAQKQNGAVRQWKCENCEAVNFLDKNGQISDPPPPPTPKPSESIRYAHAPVRTSSPPPLAASEDVFCSTCLKNQHIVRDTLSSYLPPENSPQYDEYVAAYDTYRQKLEQRYPQVCAECAPRARDRIRKSAYVAKTDHLRRMVEKTKGTGPYTSKRATINSFVFFLGGMAWRGACLSLALWHLLAALSTSQLTRNGDAPMVPSMTLDEPSFATLCARKALNGKIDVSCPIAIEPWMPVAFGVALLSSWWNPQMRTRYMRMGGAGSFVGLGEYYMVQFLFLGLLACAWAFSTHWKPSWLDRDHLRVMHLVATVGTLAVLLVSSRIVSIDVRPRVSFQMDERLLPQAPTPTPDGISAQTPRNRNRATDLLTPKAFPISKLATPPTASAFRNATPQQAPARFHQDSPDAMDWTPTSKHQTEVFNPTPRLQPIPPNAAPQGPSPFRGTLPAAPMPPAHKARRPANELPGAFKKASESQKENFFASISSRASYRQAEEEESAYGDETDADVDDALNATPRPRAEMRMAPPRFFVKEDNVDTGLEALFDEVFSIRDEPAEGAGEGNDAGVESTTGGSRGFERGGLRRTGGVFGSDKRSSWLSMILVASLPIAILCGVIALVKGFR